MCFAIDLSLFLNHHREFKFTVNVVDNTEFFCTRCNFELSFLNEAVCDIERKKAASTDAFTEGFPSSAH